MSDLLSELLGPLTCLSGVVRGHGVVSHGWVPGVHGSARWGASMVGHGAPVVGLGSSGVHAWWGVSWVGSGALGRALALGGGCSRCSGGRCRLLLHLLPGLHLSVLELLHVEGLTLGQQLLPLQLQLETETQRQTVSPGPARRRS